VDQGLVLQFKVQGRMGLALRAGAQVAVQLGALFGAQLAVNGFLIKFTGFVVG